jgi:hypothetical protein
VNSKSESFRSAFHHGTPPRIPQLARDTQGSVWIIESKGREELDLPQKMTRLSHWCADATSFTEYKD